MFAPSVISRLGTRDQEEGRGVACHRGSQAAASLGARRGCFSQGRGLQRQTVDEPLLGRKRLSGSGQPGRGQQAARPSAGPCCRICLHFIKEFTNSSALLGLEERGVAAQLQVALGWARGGLLSLGKHEPVETGLPLCG